LSSIGSINRRELEHALVSHSNRKTSVNCVTSPRDLPADVAAARLAVEI
jgi:hypothetical protein